MQTEAMNVASAALVWAPAAEPFAIAGHIGEAVGREAFQALASVVIHKACIQLLGRSMN